MQMIYFERKSTLRFLAARTIAAFIALSSIFLTRLPAATSAQTVPSATASTAQPAATPIPAPKSPLSLTLSPSSLLIETDPNTPVTSSFQVLNTGSKTEHLTVSLLTFSADASGAAPTIRQFSENDLHKDWMTFLPNSFSIEPATWKTVQVSFSPPETAALSYYYAILITRTTSAEVGEGETAIVGAPAMLALTTVRSPLAKQELQLKSFRTTKRVFEFLPVEFEVEVQNTGNIHLAPIGNIFVSSDSTKDIGQLQINKTNGLILPGSTRTYTLTWAEGFPLFTPEEKNGAIVVDDRGKPKLRLNWDFSNANLFRFGKFTGHLIFIYDDGQRDIPTEALLTFYVIPWRILAVVGFVGLLLLFGIWVPLRWILQKTKNSRKKGS